MPIQQNLTPPVLLFSYFAGWVTFNIPPYNKVVDFTILYVEGIIATYQMTNILVFSKKD